MVDSNSVDLSLRGIAQGGVTSALGFKAAGVHAGFRRNPARSDLAVVSADHAVAAAGIFTTNRFCAAPVTLSKEHLGGQGYGTARCVVVNSGNANAATGEKGMQVARASCEVASQVAGCDSREVLVASTGVIGQQLDMEPFESGLPVAFEQLSDEGGAQAAQAIMTTDTHAKECAVSYTSKAAGYEGMLVTVGGMCKGSGMIMPNMATMIAVITTDAPVEPAALHTMLRDAADTSFNRVTVDSDTSTNDTCFLLASGEAHTQCTPIKEGEEAYFELAYAVREVCMSLARGIAADGEGATKLVTVSVTGAACAEDADLAARAVANSPLVKTAIAGRDCNWGRIAAALGKSGAVFDQHRVAITIMGIPVCIDGLARAFDEDEALRRFEAPEIVIDVDLGAGTYEATVWTCDLTHDYISINGDYRS